MVTVLITPMGDSDGDDVSMGDIDHDGNDATPLLIHGHHQSQ